MQRPILEKREKESKWSAPEPPVLLADIKEWWQIREWKECLNFISSFFFRAGSRFFLLEITSILQFHYYHSQWVHACSLVWNSVISSTLFFWKLKTASYRKRDVSACDRNGNGCAKLRCWWHLCNTFVLFITFTHPHPAQVIPNTSCGRSGLHCYLMESAPANHKLQMIKAAARPRVTNTLILRVCFCGKASTLSVLLSSPFWAFRLPCKLFFSFSLKLPAVASFSLMLCPAAGASREASVCNTHCLDCVSMQAAQGHPRGRRSSQA